MSITGNSTTDSILTQKTPILGQKLYVIIIATVTIALAFFLLTLIMFLRVRNSKRRQIITNNNDGSKFLPLFCKEVEELDQIQNNNRSLDQETSKVTYDNKICVKVTEEESLSNEFSTTSQSESSALSLSGTGSSDDMGWGRCYSLRELQIATNRFSNDNVIGEGGYGVVYRGVLLDGSIVAVKNLRNNKGQAEKEFKVEVEAIGKVKHKNLVGLIGYCADGAERLLVYEYIDNGNLEQWLHGDVGPVSPLTWDIRMKIAIGTARGLAYLHEGLEPKVVHRDVKSSNILLDGKWNPKVSDFGLAKLLGSEKSFVNTRVMGTFGYVSPDYASTGMLNEANDVYSFGILLLEIISGRNPIDYSKPAGEMNLVDWFKGKVGNRRGEELVDPLINIPPPPRALKRILLVCLRCIDLDANKRPKMGQIVHMLDADEFPYRSEPRSVRDTAPLHPGAVCSKAQLSQKEVVNDDDEEERQIY